MEQERVKARTAFHFPLAHVQRPFHLSQPQLLSLTIRQQNTSLLPKIN